MTDEQMITKEITTIVRNKIGNIKECSTQYNDKLKSIADKLNEYVKSGGNIALLKDAHDKAVKLKGDHRFQTINKTKSIQAIAMSQLESSYEYFCRLANNFGDQPDMMAMAINDYVDHKYIAYLIANYEYKEARDYALRMDTASREEVSDKVWNFLKPYYS